MTRHRLHREGQLVNLVIFAAAVWLDVGLLTGVWALSVAVCGYGAMLDLLDE
ncbi:MAG: hypothetical protein ACOCY0_04620 [Roseicyclus sp.]